MFKVETTHNSKSILINFLILPNYHFNISKFNSANICFHHFSGGSLSLGELLAEVQREGIFLPRCTLPLVRRFVERAARAPPIRRTISGLC